MTRHGWMVCTRSGDPCGEVFDTEAAARQAQRGYPVGCDYHVRPVAMRIVVRGQPPQPWCFRADRRAL